MERLTDWPLTGASCISALAGKMWNQLRIPLTIVPGSLTDQELDLLA